MLTLWHPRRDLFARSFDSLLEGFNGHGGFAPAVDLQHEEDRVVLRADLPGVAEKDIEVTVHDGVLLLSGKREQTTEDQGEGTYHRERRFGSFQRQFRLGPEIAADKIEARYENGVLTVVLPRREEAKPRQIKVSAS
jgi:HSP20 family protein